ncbi:MBOAT family protein, partial [Lachnospiraceae bacterium]|nr:MBOAT family protein [Lachnospiraceae bacterium]
MVFNSTSFLIFFPIVVLVYFIMPRKIRYIWLLIASYYFYMSWNAKYAILIGFSTIITYLSGLCIGWINGSGVNNKVKVKKIVVAASFGINILILVVFKYSGFILDSLNIILKESGIRVLEMPFDIVLPVGISFYTFQALSYTMDVYRGDISAEKNILKYALFVSFFPQLVAGPIERSINLISQISEIPKTKIEYERIANGLIIMVWGFFLKLVIADRIAILVNTVFDRYYMYGTVELIVAAMGFALQIYCDFSSYSTIAIGASQIMGITLMENFNVPYFSRSIKEFWRRWHISLSTWFKDYLYIPLGGNRCSRGRA